MTDKDVNLTVDLGDEKLEVKISKKHIEDVKEHTDMDTPQVLIETENQILRSVGKLDE